jgi:hypothetical protein
MGLELSLFCVELYSLRHMPRSDMAGS